MGVRSISRDARANPSSHSQPPTPTVTPSGFLLLARPDRRSVGRSVRVSPGYLARRTGIGVLAHGGDARKRGFPARGAVFTLGVICRYPRPLERPATAVLRVPENHSHRRPRPSPTTPPDSQTLSPASCPIVLANPTESPTDYPTVIPRRNPLPAPFSCQFLRFPRLRAFSRRCPVFCLAIPWQSPRLGSVEGRGGPRLFPRPSLRCAQFPPLYPVFFF